MVTCKLGRNGCWNDGKCRATSNCENKIVTNADRIRTMTDEELAKWICEAYECYRCPGEELCNVTDGKANGALKWLQENVR